MLMDSTVTSHKEKDLIPILHFQETFEHGISGDQIGPHPSFQVNLNLRDALFIS